MSEKTNKDKSIAIIPQEKIEHKIYQIRVQKVMLDRDLAALYGVETRALNQAVKRNLKRFPSDFMFQLTREEFDILKSQFVTSRWGGIRKMPFAFTEQGIAMLSGILHSDRAIQAKIAIMRAFVKIRRMFLSFNELRQKFEELENKVDFQGFQLNTLIQEVNRLMPVEFAETKEIKGFRKKENP